MLFFFSFCCIFCWRNIFNDAVDTIDAITLDEKRKYLQHLKKIDSNYDQLIMELENQVKAKHEQFIKFTMQNK